eukprot:759209-Hanusia_phi.AAC.10
MADRCLHDSMIGLSVGPRLINRTTFQRTKALLVRISKIPDKCFMLCFPAAQHSSPSAQCLPL